MNLTVSCHCRYLSPCLFVAPIVDLQYSQCWTGRRRRQSPRWGQNMLLPLCLFQSGPQISPLPKGFKRSICIAERRWALPGWETGEGLSRTVVLALGQKWHVGLERMQEVDGDLLKCPGAPSCSSGSPSLQSTQACQYCFPTCWTGPVPVPGPALLTFKTSTASLLCRGSGMSGYTTQICCLLAVLWDSCFF